MVLLVYLYHSVHNILIKLVVHLELMDNVVGIITIVLSLRNALILMLLLLNYANNTLVYVFLMV